MPPLGGWLRGGYWASEGLPVCHTASMQVKGPYPSLHLEWPRQDWSPSLAPWPWPCPLATFSPRAATFLPLLQAMPTSLGQKRAGAIPYRLCACPVSLTPVAACKGVRATVPGVQDFPSHWPCWPGLAKLPHDRPHFSAETVRPSV